MEAVVTIEPNTLVAQVPDGLLLSQQETLRRGNPIRQETAKRLSPKQFEILQSIRRIVVARFPQAQVFLFGRASRVEIFDIEEEISDLDLLITGISTDQLLSQSFIKALSYHFQVEVAGSDTRYLKLSNMEGQHIADIDVVDVPSDSSAEELIHAMQIFAATVAVLEVQDHSLIPTSIYFEPNDVPLPIVVPAPQASGAATRRQVSTNLRTQAEIARTPSSICTVNLEQLNKFRSYWLDFRSREIDPNEIAAIDKTVNQRLEKAFLDASQIPGGQETLFLTLCHTGAFHALFPVAWACCSHRLFDDEYGRSIYSFLKAEGFSLENIQLAIEANLIPQALQNITSIVASDSRLDSTWATSYAQNVIILETLARNVILIQREHQFTAADIVFQPASNLEELTNSGRPIDMARALWLTRGVPYLQALVLVNLYHTEKVLKAGYKAAELPALTSYFDRVGIVFERVNTHLVRMLATDRLGNIFILARSVVTQEGLSQFEILCNFLANRLLYIERYGPDEVERVMTDITEIVINKPEIF